MPPIGNHSVYDDRADEDTTLNRQIKLDHKSLLAVKECDFDKEPTDLYLAIQRRDWNGALSLCRSYPYEARTWVSRKESDGKLRWRLLPLHAAIIFKAPESVIEALLSAYPKGVECKDDQGMLPLHLAFRNGSTEGIVNLLLVAYPQSIDIQDRKGRIPLVLAQASTSPNRDAFMRALERGPTYYAVAAAATERAAVTAELRAIFDAKLIEIKAIHEEEMVSALAEAQESKDVLIKRVEELEFELLKTQETSQVLVDHVNSLDAQLASRSDTERFLATKIATLDSSLRDVTGKKVELESTLVQENEQLKAENEEIKLKLRAIEANNKELTQKLDETEPVIASLQLIKEKFNKKTEEAIEKMELQTAIATANAAVLEAQLKKKIETEHTLASQVSLLAARLAESAHESSNVGTISAKRIDALEAERTLLRATIEDLSKRLQSVAKALDNMSIEQEKIVKAAATHEATMAAAAIAHTKILSSTNSQETMFAKAAMEREEILSILTRQEEEVSKSVGERSVIIEAMKAQEEHMTLSTVQRDAIVANVTTQRDAIREMIDCELDVIPLVLSDDNDLVEVVIKNIEQAKNSPSLTKETLAAQPLEVPQPLEVSQPLEVAQPLRIDPPASMDDGDENGKSDERSGDEISDGDENGYGASESTEEEESSQDEHNIVETTKSELSKWFGM
jgi:hypothetical protein